MLRIILIFSLSARLADSVSHCQTVTIPQKYWKNEGASVIYVMKNTQQNWQAQVSSLLHLKSSLKNIEVNVDITVATNQNCSAFKDVKEFKIDTKEIWRTLEHHNDYPEAYVIDRCGKVTYHIIFPWSLAKWFPYIKGAILSTFFDKPCGPCDILRTHQVEAAPQDSIKPEEIKLYPKFMKKNSEKRYHDGVPPIEVIIKEKHKHQGNDEIFEYTEMELGNSEYHRHFHQLDDEFTSNYDDFDYYKNDNMISLYSSDKPDSIADHFNHDSYKTKKKRVITRSEEQNTFSSVEHKLLDLDKKINEIALTCTEQNDAEQDSKYYGILFHSLLKTMHSEDKLNSQENEEKEQLTHHYEKLNNWISYIV